MSSQAIEDVIKITAAEAPNNIETVLRAGLVPYLVSSPAIGKSSIMKQVAETLNLKVIDLRLAGCDPTDLKAA